jgi:hypothetical protein
MISQCGNIYVHYELELNSFVTEQFNTNIVKCVGLLSPKRPGNITFAFLISIKLQGLGVEA